MFQISLHERDKLLLYKIKEFFGVGKVINRGDSVYYYNVSKFEDLILIVNHFDNYPLITTKWADFELFKKVVNMLLNKEHLTIQGLQEIVNTKASMNFRNNNLLRWFPDTVPATRPVINEKDIVIRSPEWLSGFVDGEGCFTVNVYSRKGTVLKKGVKLVFKITQDNRNINVLKEIGDLLGCGNIYSQSKVAKSNVMDLMVTGLKDISEKVIPFFLSYPLQSEKKNDFKSFLEVAKLMNRKDHLTRDGLSKILNIKETMNKRG